MFSIYCDDFQRKDHGHYTFVHIAFVLIDDLIPAFQEQINQLKLAYKVKNLHCRVLFNGSERQRRDINFNNKQVFELYQELHRFILQFPQEYCNFYINWCDYLVGDWSKIQSIKSL